MSKVIKERSIPKENKIPIANKSLEAREVLLLSITSSAQRIEKPLLIFSILKTKKNCHFLKYSYLVLSFFKRKLLLTI